MDKIPFGADDETPPTKKDHRLPHLVAELVIVAAGMLATFLFHKVSDYLERNRNTEE